MQYQSPSEVIEKIMTLLNIPDDFGMNPDEYEIDEEEYYAEMMQEDFPGAKALHGASKFVIVIPDLPYVIKIPFNGSYQDGEFYYFERAHRNAPSDYCYAEWRKYIDAESVGLECFLAKIDYYDADPNGIPYYYQEKVLSARQYNGKEASRASYEKVNSLCADQMICDEDWLARAIDYYGEELVTKFIDYVNYIDTDIGADLHSNNYGYRENGEPVILDYSGWND